MRLGSSAFTDIDLMEGVIQSDCDSHKSSSDCKTKAKTAFRRNFDLSSGTTSGLRDLKICNAPQKPNAPEKQKMIKLLSKSLALCSMPRTS